jgi:exodeoxyribonuclease VII large subunit
MRSQQLDELQMRLHNRMERTVTAASHRLDALALRLNGVDPRRQLERGYAILTHGADGKPLTSAQGVASGSAVKAILADGELALHVD